MTRRWRLAYLAVLLVLMLTSATITSASPNAVHAYSFKQRYEGPIIDAHAHPQGPSDWMVKTLEVYHEAGVDRVIFFDGYDALKAHNSRPNEIIPSLYVYYMNRTNTIKEVEAALKQGFMWVGEALLRHWGETNTPADDPAALQIYDLCAKYRVPITIHQDSKDYRGAYQELERALDHSPNCIFIFHGWWLGPGHLSMKDLERIIAKHPNLYVELAGELEASPGPPWTEQTFLGGTDRDPFAYPSGRIREAWSTIFEKYPDRFINGFDLFTQSAYKLENLKMRVDYWRNLLGQISQDTAERIAYKNVEDLLAHRVTSMTLTLSSSSVKVQDTLTITVQFMNMRGDPIPNETITFSLEGAGGTMISIGKATTDASGRAEFNYKADADAGTYWIIASYEGSIIYGQKKERSQLVVNRLGTALTLIVPRSATQGTALTIAATLRDERGQQIKNGTLDFYLITNVERKRIGSANTNVSGSASISVVPNIVGEKRIEVLYGGSGRYAESCASASLNVEAATVAVVQPEYLLYVVAGGVVVIAFIIRMIFVSRLRKKRT